jgi:hypothetical protein
MERLPVGSGGATASKKVGCQLVDEYSRTMLPTIDPVHRLKPRSVVSLCPECAWALSPIE